MLNKKHKWNGKMVAYYVDGSILACVKCGCVKQYVRGFPTYFIDDTCYDKKAPQCDNRLLTKEGDEASNII